MTIMRGDHHGGEASSTWSLDPVLDPVDLELAAGIFQSLAEEMGVSLVRSARSANIKERRDSSTAIFDHRGRLVAQAEHIPVHLGALPASVRVVAGREQSPGDVWILNHPYMGGTHLPDVTMVAPVFVGGKLGAYVATRAHHAEIGGMHGGSMSAGTRELYQERSILPDTVHVFPLTWTHRAFLRSPHDAHESQHRRQASLPQKPGLPSSHPANGFLPCRDG